MDYYKYISEYLSRPLQQVQDNAVLLHKSKWPNDFIEQYNTLEPTYVNETIIIVVPNDWLWYKFNHLSEAHSKQKIILARKEYLIKMDISASFVHNLSHIQQYHQVGEQLFQKYRQEKVFKDLSIIYPNNKMEYYAFSNQLSYLFRKNVPFVHFLDHMKQLSDEPEREIFFKRIIEHIKKINV